MAPESDMSADLILDASKRIADHLLDVQRRVNGQMDSTQASLLSDVRHRQGIPA